MSGKVLQLVFVGTGKLDGMAMRVPVPNGSVIDLVVELNTQVTIEEINEAVKFAANNDLKGKKTIIFFYTAMF